MPQDIPLLPYGPTAGRSHLSGKTPRPKTLAVDFHGHMFVPAADVLVAPHLSEESHLGRRQSNPKTREISQAQFKKRLREWSEVEERLADMDLNPVKVLPPGEGICVVDVRMRIRPIEGVFLPSRKDIPGRLL